MSHIPDLRTQIERWLGHDIAQLFEKTAQTIVVAEHTRLFQPGMACTQFVLLLEGIIRVSMTSVSGREIVLYRVNPGETCIMTTSCLLGTSPYTAEGISETPVRLATLSRHDFEQALLASATFRAFVFSQYGERLVDLIQRIEEVTFTRIDLRLASFLLRRTQANPSIALTHQEIAIELGTAREVISRQLKELERCGRVSLHRGQVSVLDREALRTWIASTVT